MALGTYVHRQEAAAAEDKDERHLASWMTNAELLECLAVITALFFPPLSVFLERGCGGSFLLNVLLTFLGFLPGLVHALYVLWKSESAASSLPSSYSRSTLASANKELTTDDLLRAASDEEAEERRKVRRERGGTVDEERELGRGRPPSYRATADSLSGSARSPAAADAQSRPGNSPTTTVAAFTDSADVEKVSTLDKDPADELAPPQDDEVPPAPHFPDGGRRAYLNTVGGVLVLFSTFGLSNSWAVFQAHLASNELKEYPASTISWIGSVQLFALFILGLPSGRLFDSGYFRYQLAGGSALWCFGMYMLSLSSRYYQFFLSYAVCLGIALGVLFAGTISCVGSYFKRKRTLMMGCTAGGAALGAVLFPIALNNLFESRGFGFGVRLLAYIHTALLILANVLMRPRDDLPPRKAPPILPQIASFLHQPQTWFASLGCAFVMLGMFIPVFAEEHGASETVVQYCAAILNGAAFVARITVGFAADRFGNLTVAIPTTIIIATMIFAMLGATSSGGVIAFCILFGAASGAWVTIMAPSLISLSASVREFGVRTGLGFILISIAALFGSPVAGAILRATPSSTGTNYLGVCIFGGCAVLVGTVCLSATWWLQRRRKGTWRV
ncbi:hypothetical protein JCM9279_003163 [Rhodotorula babjevae]